MFLNSRKSKNNYVPYLGIKKLKIVLPQVKAVNE
jgi:hypothetical protein